MALSKIDSASLNSGLTFTGQQTIPTINLTGGQITFPATQVPSANANTLDDYEEGTWSASVTGQSGTFTGIYTRVGNTVVAALAMTANSTPTNTDPLYLQGLPFTCVDVCICAVYIKGIGVGGGSGVPSAAPGNSILMAANGVGSTTAYLRSSSTDTNPYYYSKILATGSGMQFTFVYQTP